MGRRWAHRGMLVAMISALVISTGASASTAGNAGDYPEFPYPATNYQEDNRGQFHFSSRGGWLNDVNAPIYYKGVYHLYYQHNPHGLAWDTMHWGHATSTDLVHWTQKPIALEPGVHPGDLWSGDGVVDSANTSGLKNGAEDPIVAFTNTNGVSVVYSLDGGNTFRSYDSGRKVVTPVGTSRDPKVFWDKASASWIMAVWSDEGGNGVNIYRSANLLDWQFASRFHADWLFECPDFVPMPVVGDKKGTTKYVLSDASGEYVVGDFDGHQFTTDWTGPQRVNRGANYYAGLTFQNVPGGRIVQMAWQAGNAGTIWTGNMTFPVEMKLVPTSAGLRIRSTPVAELASLRTSTTAWSNKTLSPSAATALLGGIKADATEIDATIDVRGSKANRIAFRLHTGPNGWADREVVYDKAAGTLDGNPLPARADGTIRVQMLIDRGQLEIYGNDGDLYESLNVNFDSLPGGPGIALQTDGQVRVRSLVVHDLASIWDGAPATLHSNLTGPWYAASGTWSDVSGGIQGSSGGDAFYLNTQTGSDFVYEGDVKVGSGVAASLTMRSNQDASHHYTVNVDMDAGVVKLWRPGRDIATFHTPLERGRAYHLKVKAVGSHFQVWFDGSADPVIDATDDTIASGQFGLNAFNATAVVQNVMVSPAG